MAQERQTDAVRALYEAVTIVANQSLDVAEALERGLSHVCRTMGWPVGHAMLIEGNRLEPTTIWFVEDPEEFTTFQEVTGSVTFEFGRGEGPLRRTAISREPTWLVDVTSEDDFQRARLADDIGVRGALMVPVLVGDDTVAVLEVYSRDPMEPDTDVIDVMRHVGVQLGRVFERQRVREAEQRALDAERRYLRMAAHEMITPLVSAAGYVDLLLDEGDDADEERREALHATKRSLDTLRKLAQNFLIDARLHGGTMRAHTEPCEAAKIIQDALSDIPPIAEQVEVRCPSDVVVRADPFLLRQALVNLLTNADRYGEPPVIIDCRRVEGRIEICVSDHGPGVDAAFVPRLFERFTKAADAGQGVGIGLEIVAGLASLHDGNVRYEPNDPCGARFILSVPEATTSA